MKISYSTTINAEFAIVARLGGNTKTGNAIAVSILPIEGLNLENVRANGSRSCGDCPHAKKSGKRKMGTCYVYKRPGGSQGALGGIQKAYIESEKMSNEIFIKKVSELADIVGFLRCGEFGDPAISEGVAELFKAIIERVTVTHTMYTHHWQKERGDILKGLAMASCDNEEQVLKANSKGWGTFEVIPRKAEKTTFLCPAVKNKLVNCNTCGLCNGRKLDIQVNQH